MNYLYIREQPLLTKQEKRTRDIDPYKEAAIIAREGDGTLKATKLMAVCRYTCWSASLLAAVCEEERQFEGSRITQGKSQCIRLVYLVFTFILTFFSAMSRFHIHSSYY